jgi:hypothetical protein
LYPLTIFPCIHCQDDTFMLDNKIWTCSPTQPRVKLPQLKPPHPVRTWVLTHVNLLLEFWTSVGRCTNNILCYSQVLFDMLSCFPRAFGVEEGASSEAVTH